MFDLSINIDSGWVELIIDDTVNRISMHSSYLSDSIKDFLSAAAMLLGGNGCAECRWEDEPGQYGMLFEADGLLLRIKILRFEETFSCLQNEKGSVIFETEEDLLKFSRKISREMERILIEYGADGYKRLWGHEYPAKEVNQLRKSLNHRL